LPRKGKFEFDRIDKGVINMDNEDELSEDDYDEEDSDDHEEAEEDDDFGESSVTESKIGYCCICGWEVIVDELPDSISKDAFQDFGLCLNCQWGIFMENGGHF
jgi:hypothetical protein